MKLDSVPINKAFIHGEKRITNLLDLLLEFKNMSDEEYSHYVSEDHNYFADWILHVIMDKDLSKKLRNSITRKDSIKILEKTINNFNTPKKVKVEPPIKKEDDTVKTPSPKLIEDKELKKKLITETKKDTKIEEVLNKISNDETDIKYLIYKHHSWEMAKEFMYGMSLGIFIGLILSKIFLP